MTPSSSQSLLNQLNFGKLNGRKVIANFAGGRITSDAGILLIAELDKKLKITARFAECFQDNRHSSYNELMETLFSKDEDLEEVPKLVPNSTWFRSLCYQTEKSWSRQRRVVTKVCYGSEGLKIRHVVTSLSASKIPPSKLYTDKYCPRGEMENRIKEQQLDLFADRTSTQTFESNQLRLWLSSMAYVLMQAFRQHCLAKTSLAKATVGTIRLNLLLKLGARITVSVRRILMAIASSCPYQDILGIAYSRIQAIPDTG